MRLGLGHQAEFSMARQAGFALLLDATNSF
jgi:hypothetical protein